MSPRSLFSLVEACPATSLGASAMGTSCCRIPIVAGWSSLGAGRDSRRAARNRGALLHAMRRVGMWTSRSSGRRSSGLCGCTASLAVLAIEVCHAVPAAESLHSMGCGGWRRGCCGAQDEGAVVCVVLRHRSKLTIEFFCAAREGSKPDELVLCEKSSVQSGSVWFLHQTQANPLLP